MDDDKEAAVDKEIREAILKMLEDMQADESYSRIERIQRAQIERLMKMLKTLKHGPEAGLMGNQYLASLRGLSEGQLRGQEDCAVYMDDEQLSLYSKCKTVKYCSKECQMKDWKDGHKIKCFATTY